MADSYALAMQAALATWLPANPNLSALVADRIYDEPPQNATRPYVRFNDFEPRPLRSTCGAGATLVFSLEVHSRPNSGRVEATQCAEALVDALDKQPVAVEGFTLVKLNWLTQTVDRDSDGDGYSAIVVFEATLDG